MINGSIDNAADGAVNQERLQAIRHAVARDFSGAYPFLLLPVRVETRFMTVDVETATASASPVSALTHGLTDVRNRLLLIASRPLTTSLGGVPRRQVRSVEIANYAFLDGVIAELRRSRGQLTDLIHNCTGAARELAALATVADGVLPAAKTALANVRSMRSAFQGQAYAAQLQAAVDEVIRPLLADVREVASPKIQLSSDLLYVDAAELTTKLTATRTAIQARTSPPPRTDAAAIDALRFVNESLRDLRTLAHRVQRGTANELAAVGKAWPALDASIAAFDQMVAPLSLASSGQQARTTTLPQIRGARADLAVLAESHPRQLLANSHLERSAVALGAIGARLQSLTIQLEQVIPPAPEREERAVTLAELTARETAMVAALSRDVSIAPAATYTSHAAARTRVANAFERWRPILADAAGRSTERARHAAEARDAAQGGLDQLVTAILGQRTDDLAVYQGPDGAFATERRTVLTVRVTATRTDHQLWVRFYPDEIAIHTHEERFTEEEVQSGKDYWSEVLAAGGEEARLKAAWRGLVERHGSRRGAFIARELDPARAGQTPSAVTTAARPQSTWLSALRTLDRRAREIQDAPGWFLRDPAERLGRAKMAADAVIAALAAGRATTAERGEARDLLVTVRARLTDLEQHVARREKFLAAPTRVRAAAAAAAVATRLTTIDAGIATLPADTGGSIDVSQIVFPDVPRKDHTWSAPAVSKVMPDRFVVLTVAGGSVTHVVVGEPVPSVLQVGLDPSAATSPFLPDASGNLALAPEIRWLTDFDEAVARGMGARITLTASEASRGFDEVLVLGVRSGSATDTRTLVEKLLDNHHFGEQGLSLVPVGTPTNNTESSPSGHRRDDDADATYPIERGPDLYTPTTGAAITDGQRAASALGVGDAVFQHVASAGGLDVSRAMLVNQALWPATLGAFGEEFLGSLVAIDSLTRVEDFFRRNVAGRGMVPSVRVGSQPYGILTTTAFSRFASTLGTSLPSMPAQGPDAIVNENDRARRFEILFLDLLAAAARDWSRVRAAKVKHAHNAQGDAQRHFMEMLGLHAGSVRAEYRFALNVANRHPGTVQESGLRFGTAAQGPYGLLAHFKTFFERAFGIPSGPLVHRGLVTEPYKALYKRIFDERAYDVRVLDQARVITGPVVSADHVGDIAQLLAANAFDLRDDGIRGHGRSTSLFYLVLRHALLMRLRWAALEIAQRSSILDVVARRKAGTADEFALRTLASDDAISKWSYLFSPVADLRDRFGLTTPTGAGTLYKHLNDRAAGPSNRPERSLARYLEVRGNNAVFDGFSGTGKTFHTAERTRLQEHASAVDALKTIPAAQLEGLVREHLDLCSYRLDAWQVGLAARRLAEMRAVQARGVFLGAFGWVENLRPGGARTLATDLPPSLDIPGEPPIYDDADDQGFVHTPSLGHAVTAAVLRSGYLTETRELDVENRMAVNLGSRRVRMALELLEGVHAGEDLGALLGYRFERALHDAYQQDGITLDALISKFRRAFPGIAAVDPANPTPELATRAVTDGMRLLDTVRRWIDANHVPAQAERSSTVYEVLHADGAYTGHPWNIREPNGTKVMPDRTGAEAAMLPGVLRAIDELADAVDALGDLALTEGLYQTVRGNFPRAAAVLSALAEGKPMPRPEVVDTPRTGLAVTHRVVLPLRRFDGRGIVAHLVSDATTLAANRTAALPSGWTGIPMTARSNAEPGLNHWLGELLGKPADIRVRYRDHAVAGAPVRTLSAVDLELQPLDLLALVGPGLDEAEAELAARLAAHSVATVDLNAALAAGPRPAIELLLVERDPSWPVAVKTLFEVAALLTEAHDLAMTARPVDADDLALSEAAVRAGEGAAPAVDGVEIAARATESVNRLRTLVIALMTELNGGAAPPEDPLTIDAATYAETHRAALGDAASVLGRQGSLLALILRARQFGGGTALPPARFDTVEATAAGITAALCNSFVQLTGALQKATALGEKATAAGDVAGIVAALGPIFGRSFRVVPHVTVRDAAVLRGQLAGSALTAHAGPFAVDAFLQGAAAVREPLAHHARLMAVAEAFGHVPPLAKPAQLPVDEGDHWLGSVLPADYEPRRNKVSIVALAPERWELVAAPIAALLLDEWTETIPSRTETTGVAFFYDQPDAAPPQSLLLAVPPSPRATWQWDDLVHTLHDTLELARNRTVELEHLGEEVYGQLLPAVTGELVPDRFRNPSAAVSAGRVILDFHINNG
jgi:hypothetical protein